MTRSTLRFCAAAMAFLPVAASAHVGAGDTHGFVHGLAHPLSGIDHVLAMVAVGLFAAHLGGRAMWLVPLTFVSVMALAGIAGMAGVKLPFVEVAIGMSVVVLGLAVAFQISVPTLAAMFLVGFLQSSMVTLTGQRCRKAFRDQPMAEASSAPLHCSTR
jgi:urease accessory protein